MGRLSDILQNGDGDRIRRTWDSTEAADDFKPLPPGNYVARIVSGELFTAKTNGTPGYKLTFKVLEGEHAGRQFWHDNWLTPAALPMTKRDLSKLGISSLDQLEAPLPKGIRCAVKLALQTADDGTRFNKVKRFDVIGIDPPDLDPFAPKPASLGDAAEPPASPPSEGADTSTANGTGDIPF